MSKLKILFLDVDGVLNNEQYITDHRTDPYPLDIQKISLVNQIKQKTGCYIVISSLWRYSREALDVLRSKGIDYYGITPCGSMSSFRGQDIQDYCNQVSNRIERIAILDNDSDFYSHQKKALFKTSFKEGLTKEIAEKVIAHLGEVK